MLGKRSDQRGLFEADQLYLDFVGRDSFYGFLASQRGQLFRDEEFVSLYVLENGCPSVPPSLLATALLLQTYDGVSDEEAKARADFDLRWKVALGIGIEERPFAKSTLQLFRAHLILKEKVQAVFKKSLTFARQTGYLKRRRFKLALDTSNILGRGAVKDTYNLLAAGIVKLVRELAALVGVTAADWAQAHDLVRYFGEASLKGEASVDWGDAKARQEFLRGIVADADRLLAEGQRVLASYPEGSVEQGRLKEGAELLSQLLLQDIERGPEGARIKEGVAADRIVSVSDPEMRHGRKSKSKRFDGHKGAVAVEPESQLITAAAVLAGNASDHEKALALVKESEENAEATVEEAIGDCAYGDGLTRQEFAEAGCKLVAKVPDRPETGYFAKEDFAIDLEALTCTCPAKQATSKLVRKSGYKDREGKNLQSKAFLFDAAQCESCPLRAKCVKTTESKGRTVSLHPQERLLQEARAFQRSEAFAPYRRWRQAAEHRLSRLMQLGVRQARYIGRAKTLYQLLLGSTVANLTLVATKTGLMRGRGRRQGRSFARILGAVTSLAALAISIVYNLGPTRNSLSLEGGCRPRF